MATVRLRAKEPISLGVGSDVLKIAPGDEFLCPVENAQQLFAFDAVEGIDEDQPAPTPASDPAPPEAPADKPADKPARKPKG